MDSAGDTGEGPSAGVTLAVARKPRAGKASELEGRIHDLVEAAATFSGYQGASVVRPAPGRPEYLLLLRFATEADLRRWRSSKTCRELVAKANAITDGPSEVRELHGLEAWIDVGNAPAPPRWKMAVLTWIALYPSLVATTLAVSPLIGDWPVPLQLLVTTAALVPVMTWGLMPAMTWLARAWL